MGQDRKYRAGGHGDQVYRMRCGRVYANKDGDCYPPTSLNRARIACVL